MTELNKKPEVGDAKKISELVDFLFGLDLEIGTDDHPEFGKLISTVKLQCVEDGHSKYWHGTLYEKGHVRRWGKIGTKGQFKEFPAGSKSQAEEAFDKIVRQKSSKYDYATEKQAEEHIKE